MNFEENKALDLKIKNSQKKPNSIYEISRIKKSSLLKNKRESIENPLNQGRNEKLPKDIVEKDQTQISDLAQILKYRQIIMKFNPDKKIDESLIDFSIGFKKEEEIKFLEEISKAHSNFLNMCFDENCSIYFFSEKEKKYRASIFSSVVDIHNPDKDVNNQNERKNENNN